MALRQAGGGASRLLLLRPAASGLAPAGGAAATAAAAAAAGVGAGAPALPQGLAALALHAASLHLGAPRRGGPPPLLLPRPWRGGPWLGPEPWALGGLRGLQAPSERKEDAAAKALPDAQACDEAIDKYREVRRRRAYAPVMRLSRGGGRSRGVEGFGGGGGRECAGRPARLRRPRRR
jgi:hypothetical protein